MLRCTLILCVKDERAIVIELTWSCKPKETRWIKYIEETKYFKFKYLKPHASLA